MYLKKKSTSIDFDFKKYIHVKIKIIENVYCLSRYMKFLKKISDYFCSKQ